MKSRIIFLFMQWHKSIIPWKKTQVSQVLNLKKLKELEEVIAHYGGLRSKKSIDLLLPIIPFARLSTLISNRAKRSDNFYNF